MSDSLEGREGMEVFDVGKLRVGEASQGCFGFLVKFESEFFWYKNILAKPLVRLRTACMGIYRSIEMMLKLNKRSILLQTFSQRGLPTT